MCYVSKLQKVTLFKIGPTWGRFFVHFSGENFGENSAENFPPKNVGKKNGIFCGKSFKKSFFQEIPRNFQRKVIFRGKKCTKNLPHLAEIWHRLSG
jgi:hypothetical protein